MFGKKEQESLEKLVDGLVMFDGFSGSPNLDEKIQLLCFVLEQLKYERGLEANQIRFEDYIQGATTINTHCIGFTPAALRKDPGSGRNAIHLQAPLLLFLLLNHKERYQVLEIIKLFIENIRSELGFLDFKKTETGATRCFTNTRFAAAVLRDYGLLRFSKREAFKTWELSLAGFLVAASLLSKRAKQKRPWYELDYERDWKFDLLPEIRDACKGLSTYDDFVVRLASICEPDATIFKTFEPALRQAFGLLQGYWALLSDQTKSQEERRKASSDRIKQLDTLGDKFFKELSSCIQINDLLGRTINTSHE